MLFSRRISRYVLRSLSLKNIARPFKPRWYIWCDAFNTVVLAVLGMVRILQIKKYFSTKKLDIMQIPIRLLTGKNTKYFDINWFINHDMIHNSLKQKKLYQFSIFFWPCLLPCLSSSRKNFFITQKEPPACCKVDLEMLRCQLGAGELHLASEKEMAQLFPECQLGAEPPFENIFGMATIMDKNLAPDRYIVFQAGKHDQAIRLNMQDYNKLVLPRTLEFSYHLHWKR